MSSPESTWLHTSGSPPRLMRAALEAAHTGHAVFPLWPRSKKPALSGWEAAATFEDVQIRTWWTSAPYNIGIACGPSGLHVLDLDDAHGHEPPPEWLEARGGQDVLARLAAAAGRPYPDDTYAVATPNGGLHLYFHAPDEPQLRSTIARLGWRIDTRGAGGYIIAAGSVRPEGCYRAQNRTEIAPLPWWLVEALTPPPPSDPVDLALPAGRASAYVATIINNETNTVTQASTGSRHATLLHAAGTLGRLVGGGELDEHAAHTALREAAERHIGHDGFTEREVETTIRDGLTWGSHRPRYVDGFFRARPQERCSGVVPGLSISAEPIRTSQLEQGRLTASLRDAQAHPCPTSHAPIRESQIDSPSSTNPVGRPGSCRWRGASMSLNHRFTGGTSWPAKPRSPSSAT